MDQNRKEKLLTLWMDDALSADDRRELEPYLSKHPELEVEREEFVRLRDELRSVLPSHVEPPYPEFFNTHLMRQIREEERAERVEVASVSPNFWKWMRLWLVPAAAAAVVASFIAGMQMGGGDQGAVAALPAEVVPVTYSAVASVDVHFESIDDEVTAIFLDGLEEIPSSVDLLKTTASLEEEDSSDEVF